MFTYFVLCNYHWVTKKLTYLPFSISDNNHFFIEISEKNHFFLPRRFLSCWLRFRSRLDSNQAGSLIPVSLPPCPHAPQTAPLSAFTAELGLFCDGLASARRGATVGLTAASSIFPFSIGIASKIEKLTRLCSGNPLPTILYDLFIFQWAS